MDARGISEAELIQGARRSTVDELASAAAEAGKILVFQSRALDVGSFSLLNFRFALHKAIDGAPRLKRAFRCSAANGRNGLRTKINLKVDRDRASQNAAQPLPTRQVPNFRCDCREQVIDANVSIERRCHDLHPVGDHSDTIFGSERR